MFKKKRKRFPYETKRNAHTRFENGYVNATLPYIHLHEEGVKSAPRR